MKQKELFKKDSHIPFNYSPHSPHSIIFNTIKENTTILDIGCNSGLLGKELLKKHVVSDGVDINPVLINQAKKYYRQTFIRNLYLPQLNISPQKYDYIVLSDILEHLPRPDLLLLDLGQYLKKSGIIIVSLPNIARLEIRLQLLFGKFDYGKNGILSSDHLRFFTKKTAIQMFQSVNCSVVNIIPTGLGHQFPFLSDLLAFQFVFLLKSNHA
jgi:2-polyprenyl-3-methyl-5-hydroxy-6-metoxy-1,4-benzoquinol methylase